MPLPVPNLDDRRFQDIVDQAKSMIPRYCPEWTDHNVSDPGVALIELFAWMTDMLLYRVNQVPDKLYVKFLELIGVRLEPPRAARSPVTFYLSAAQPAAVTIPADTEVATVRTETSAPIVFTTEADLTIRPPVVTGAFTRSAAPDGNAIWTAHDLRQLELPGQRIALFSAPANATRQPAAGDAFYLALRDDHSNHVLALTLDCETAGGAGVDPTNPPLEWQVYEGGARRWAPCTLEYDGTGGFNVSGEIVVRTPAMVEAELESVRAYWLRCRLSEAQAGTNSYKVSPDLERVRVEARGGTVGARHATTIQDELLGESSGAPGESFTLLHTPLLARDPQQDYLLVEWPGGEPERWQEVLDFADSGPGDRHFLLDSLDGTLALGPALLQPDGTVYQFGAVPPKGSRLRFRRYQYGGGVTGNVPRHALSVPKSSIPYVAHVTNWEAAVGGRDAQSLDDAKLRAPQTLRTRTRAVTVEDYQYLACQVPGVARASCLAPGAQPGGPADPRPGQVFVVVVPRVEAAERLLPPEALALSAELRAAVRAYLDERRVLGSTLDVVPPQYTWVAVEATLRVAARSDASLFQQVQQQAEMALYQYLNPFLGGPQGSGWPFGRDLHLSEISGLLQRVPSVEFVEDVRMSLQEPSSTSEPRPLPPRLSLVPHGLVCSGRHQVSVR